MEARHLHTRFAALVVGALAAVVAACAIAFSAPSQANVEDGIDYGYVYSGVKSSSVPFMRSAMDSESLLMFGSSEFSTPAKTVPEVPATVFGRAEYDYGLHLMLVGEAFDQSLWHSIALGACAKEGVPRDKVVIFVGPGWFADGGLDSDTFATRFSYALYEGFCANERISDDVKSYVRHRLESLGVEETLLNAAAPTLPQDYLNAIALRTIEDLKTRRGLEEVRSRGLTRPLERNANGPDFDALREQALKDASEKSTTNDWGLEDRFYVEQLEPVLDDLKGARAEETYSDTEEYDDFNCFLTIADACGIEVLVVIEPELGPYYDHIGITADTRKACYDRIREVALAHNARIADFSDREYEKYFMFDIVHFGWTGWVEAEKSVWDFAMKGA